MRTPLIQRRLVILCTALACVLIACGGEPTSNPNVSSITYWRTLTGAAGAAQDELVAAFNASHTDIRISVEFQGDYADLATKLMTAAVANRGPDVTQLGTFEIREFAKAGLLVDLRPFVTGPDGLDTSDWPPDLLAAGEVDGGLYWLPFNVTVPILYYNKTALDDAKVSMPETWADFFAAVRTLTLRDPNGRVTRAGLALWNSTWPVQSIIWSEGGELNSRDYTSVTLDDPVAVEVFTQLQQLVKEGAAIVPDKASGGHRAAFIAGRAALILDSPAPFSEIFTQATSFEPAVAMYPAGRAGKVYAPGGGGIAMWARAPETAREPAWQFMKFLLAPEQLAFYAERSGYTAFTKASQQAAGEWLSDPRYATVHQALPHLRGDFSLNMSPPLREAFDRAFQRILIEGADVTAALAEADAQAEAALAKAQR